MRAISSITSLSIHAAVAAAFLLGTTKSGRTSPPTVSPPIVAIFPEPMERRGDVSTGLGIPVVTVPPAPDVDLIPFPGAPLPQTEVLTRPMLSTGWIPVDRSGGGERTGWSDVSETGPELLAGPLPAYPDLLRQAGVEGQVVLEARVDTTGRVRRGSVVVVAATHPGFVEPARQALIATLFRPARVNGRAVPMLVRVPFAFSIRGGTGHAR